MTQLLNSIKCCGSISPLIKFCFPLCLGMVVYNNEFKAKENNI